MRSQLMRLLRIPNPWIGSIESTTSPGIVLTFDDGPDPDQTPVILRSLSSHQARATFFVLLTRARLYPALVRAIVEEGHEIGLHGADHVDLTTLSYREVLRRTVAAKRELEDLTGQHIRWFRPPYGRLSPSATLAVRRSGLTVALWSASASDWQPVSPAERRSAALGEALPGAIFLAHDGFADDRDGSCDGDAALLERGAFVDELMDDFASLGLVGRSLGEALELGRARKTLLKAMTGRRGRASMA